MKIDKICINCSCDFSVDYKQRDKKFCSRTCYFEYGKKNNILGRNKSEELYEVRKCKVCDSNFEVKKNNKKEMCSDECRKVWASYGINKTNRLNKSKESLVKKYGVDSVFKIKETQNKIKKTVKDKYGVDNPMFSVDIKDKLKITLRNKQLESLLPKLGNNNIRLNSEYTKNKFKNTSISYEFECLKCNHIFSSTVLGSVKIPICRKCNPIQKNSNLELIISEFLNEHNIKHKTGDRKVLNGKELDIYIPSHNIAIEINGNYWHTELFGEKDKNYHIDKTKLCNDNGITLIHIFEDEILFKKDIVFSRLMNKLNITNDKIYARKCDIKEVPFNDKKEFLDNNHIQGNSIDKIRFGLYYNDELVSLMTFSKQRISLGKKSDINKWELNRFCSKLNTNIIGGFSKLLNYFIKIYNPSELITYADIRWSGINDNVYSDLFKFNGITSPNYWYVKKGQYLHRHHRFSFRKDVLVNEGYDSNKTEWEIMQERGYDRIWDCGNMKYILK